MMSGRGVERRKPPKVICENRKCVPYHESYDEEDYFQDAESYALPKNPVEPQEFPSSGVTNKTKVFWPKSTGEPTKHQKHLNFVPAGAPIGGPRLLPKVCRNPSRKPRRNENSGWNEINQDFISGRGRTLASLQEKKQKDSPVGDFGDWNCGVSTSTLPEKPKKSDASAVCKPREAEKNPDANCSCESCDSFSNCEEWLERNTKFFEERDEEGRRGPALLNKIGFLGNIKLSQIQTRNVLLHGQIIPTPITQMKDSCFKEAILNALRQMDCYKPREMQSYIWCAIFRRLSVFLISPEQSGKTMAYVPPLCAIALEYVDSLEPLEKYPGPVILVLCKDERKKRKVLSLIEKVYEDFSEKPLVNAGRKTDILVTTAEELEAGLKSEVIDLRRLLHVVLENADVLMKSSKNISKFIKIFHEIQCERVLHKQFQIIATAEEWSLDLENLLKRLNIPPLVCFADYFEACLYARTKFIKKKFNSNFKKCYLLDILKNKYGNRKTVIFCNDEEIAELSVYMQMNGIENIQISSEIEETCVDENETIWSSTRASLHKVLLISDEMFEQTEKITTANWIIHYSLPEDLSLFRARFRCLSSTLKSPLNPDNDDDNIFILILDENCNFEEYSNLSNDIAARMLIPHLTLEL